MLVRKYNCDIAFTPMIIANSFVQSLKARDNEFTTSAGLFQFLTNYHKILYFGSIISEQTVQTQIRLLLKSDQSLSCLSFYVHRFEEFLQMFPF